MKKNAGGPSECCGFAAAERRAEGYTSLLLR